MTIYRPIMKDTQALLYHTHHQQYLEDLPYWLGLAKRCGGPLLELGCGTGRVMLPLLQAGFQVTGLDRDPEMLAYLQTLAAQFDLDAPDMLQADITDFKLDRRFPLIILPCNTYSTLSAAQRAAALDCVRAHLSPGGTFAASMPNPAWLAEFEGDDENDVEIETVFLHPESGDPVQASNEWRRSGDQLEITWHYDHLLPDGRVERSSQSTRHWLDSAEAYIEELKNGGFQVQTFGDFDREAYSSETPYLIFEAVL